MAARFYTVEALGPKRALTPEGFLVCHDVPLARTGVQEYGSEEVPPSLTAGRDGVVRVTRTPDEVFRPATVLSASGKPVVDDHPPPDVGDITPLNWKERAIGHVMNVRRGTGELADCMVGDLMITDAAGIKLVQSGKREVSCGYDADYIATGDGAGEQRNILINHVALVDAGRCGPRCAIGDRARGDEDMPKNVLQGDAARKSMWARCMDRIRKAAKDGDPAELEAALAAAPAAAGMDDDPVLETGGASGETHHHVHIHPTGGASDDVDPALAGATGGEADPAMTSQHEVLMAMLQKIMARLDALEGGAGTGGTGEESGAVEIPEGGGGEEAGELDRAHDDATIEKTLEMETPPGTQDRAKRIKARDAALLADAHRRSVAVAEVIAPGAARWPAFDAKIGARRSVDTICAIRRRALGVAAKDESTRATVDAALGLNGAALDVRKMSCDALGVAFRAVGAAVRTSTNDSVFGANGAEGGDHDPTLGFKPVGKIRTMKELNAAFAEHYNKTAR